MPSPNKTKQHRGILKITIKTMLKGSNSLSKGEKVIYKNKKTNREN